MKKGRRKKVRYVQHMPKVDQFSPRGRPGRPDEVELRVDRYEAIKLADFQGYSQSEGATLMGLSRPTFGRILREGRKILADALVNGKTIYIRNGSIQIGVLKKTFPHKKDLVNAQRAESFVRRKIIANQV